MLPQENLEIYNLLDCFWWLLRLLLVLVDYHQWALLARMHYNIDHTHLYWPWTGHQWVNSANKVKLGVKWQASYDDGVYSPRQVCIYRVVDKGGGGLEPPKPPLPGYTTDSILYKDRIFSTFSMKVLGEEQSTVGSYNTWQMYIGGSKIQCDFRSTNCCSYLAGLRVSQHSSSVYSYCGVTDRG